MDWIHYVPYFLGGAFLANALPHFCERRDGTPFSKPVCETVRSRAFIFDRNVLWGFLNLAAGYLLVCRVGDFDLRSTGDIVALGLGVLLLSVIAARGFGRFHGGNSPGGSREAR